MNKALNFTFILLLIILLTLFILFPTEDNLINAYSMFFIVLISLLVSILNLVISKKKCLGSNFSCFRFICTFFNEFAFCGIQR